MEPFRVTGRNRTFRLHTMPGRPDAEIIVVPQTGSPGPLAYLWAGAKGGPCLGTIEGAKLRDLARHILKARGDEA